MRQSGGPITSSRDTALGLVAHEGMNETKNREASVAAVLAIGVRQQSAYQRKTLPKKRRHRTASAPAVSFTTARRHLENVRAAGGVEHVRPLEEARERLTVLAVADEPEAGGRRNLARHAAHVTAPAAKREV